MVNGRDGENCHVILRPGTEQERVTGMVYEAMGRREILTNCSGGGGGWGNPFKRDPEAVLGDVRDGYVSIESAYRDYGVAIKTETMSVDIEATAKMRKESKELSH
jgi:N-methylhydantoinase B